LGFARGKRMSGCRISAVALGFAQGGRSSGWRSSVGFAGGSGAGGRVAEQFVQLLVNGLITGSILALTGVGASLVFGITDVVVKELGVPPASVEVLLIEVPREHWAFGGNLASQQAPASSNFGR
jgi:phenylpyruvate tautomerase PptA (4-oxalocrotonate tautomerase family)